MLFGLANKSEIKGSCTENKKSDVEQNFEQKETAHFTTGNFFITHRSHKNLKVEHSPNPDGHNFTIYGDHFDFKSDKWYQIDRFLEAA
jgi:hypothetical protein